MVRKVVPLMVALVLALAMPAFAAGNLNINLGQEPPNLDAQTTTDTIAGQLLSYVNEGLVRYDNKGGYMPGMAEKWDVSKDGKTYTFTMRKGVTWSNGDPVTAADFEFGTKRALDPKVASQYAYILYDIKNAEKANTGEVGLDQVGVKADGNKVIYTLERPLPYFLSILCFPTALPCNEKFLASVGDKYAAEASTLLYNGPYVIKEWKHSDKMIFAKNEKYWNKAKISLDTITGYMITDSNTAITMFYNKELDIIGVPGPRIAEVKGKGYNIGTYSDGSSWYLMFNTTDKTLSNAKIRKALTYALDRASFVKNVIMNDSQPALSFVAPLIPGAKKTFREEAGNYFKDNDPAAAKQMLAEGMKELGISTPPAFSMLCDDTDRAKVIAAAVQDMVKKNLGVDFIIEPMPFKARIQKMTDKDFQMVFAGWGPDYNDPMTYIDMWITDGGNNNASYSSKAYDDLVAKAKAEPNAATRMKYLLDAEKVLMTDMPIGPVYYRFVSWTTQSNISGVVRRSVGPDPDLYWTVKK
jgi:oligopeptide transport system substrate-binding protein